MSELFASSAQRVAPTVLQENAHAAKTLESNAAP